MKIFFAPDYPCIESYALTAMMHHLEYLATLNPEDEFDVAMLWEDKTFLDVPPTLESLSHNSPVLNIRCTDISKQRVEAAFTKSFGYSSLVDPTIYAGPCIEKPDENALRYGSVVHCPIAQRKQDYVYQKLIDTRPDDYQREFRTPVILGEIPLVYVSTREFPVDDLSACRRLSLQPTPCVEIYSQEEITMILSFSDEIGMDIGELDLMRDKKDGRLYVLDANKTPSGFGLLNKAGWSPGDCKHTTAVLAQSLQRGLSKLLQGKSS